MLPDRHFTAVIVGGGITGLSAAWYLEKLATEDGPDISIALVERDSHLGGKIRSHSEGNFTIEAGPDGFLIRKPWAYQLANELGLADDIVYTQASGASLLRNGRLHDIPRGLMGPAPASWRDIWSASFLSWHGKLRASLEPLIKRREDVGLESLGQFLSRRLGAELTDTLLEPLTAGIYGGNSYSMSLNALFPMLEQWEEQYGSITRGMKEARKLASWRPQPPSAFFSLADGASELVSAIAENLSMTEIVCGHAAVSVERPEDESTHRGWRLLLDDGRVLDSDVVVLANPAWDAGRLVRSFAPRLAHRLGVMQTSAAGSVYLAFRRDSVSRLPEGTGYLAPRSEQGLVTGCTLMSSKWPNRSPGDYVLMRAFLGWSDDESFLDFGDEELAEIATDTFRPLFGIDGVAERHWVQRWQEGMPQYKVDHTEWLADLDSQLEEHSGLFLCGSSYRGIGVPDYVRQGREAAERTRSYTLNLSQPGTLETAQARS